MFSQNVQTEETCPRSELAAYIDGELAPGEEMALEMHLAVCDVCRAQLNEEKKLLCALDYALEEKPEIHIPKDFAKVVATRAESSVSGLRNRKERPTALFLCVSLALFALIGFGTETGHFAAVFFGVFEKIAAVVLFSAHLLYDVAFGTVVILRSISGLLSVNTAFFAAVVAAALLISIAALPRLVANGVRENQKK
jgi:Predicted integral membrane protein